MTDEQLMVGIEVKHIPAILRALAAELDRASKQLFEQSISSPTGQQRVRRMAELSVALHDIWQAAIAAGVNLEWKGESDHG